jgi:hypothetical protein
MRIYKTFPLEKFNDCDPVKLQNEGEINSSPISTYHQNIVRNIEMS